MTRRSVSHSSFIIERDFAVPPMAVFQAWSASDAKRFWFACHDDMMNTDYHLDFRVGGSERSCVVTPDGTPHLFEAHFLDIVQGERIVYAYNMHLAETRLSASLATVEFHSADQGARMVFTEQVAFLDGHQDRGERIRGTELGLDRLSLLLQGGLQIGY